MPAKRTELITVRMDLFNHGGSIMRVQSCERQVRTSRKTHVRKLTSLELWKSGCADHCGVVRGKSRRREEDAHPEPLSGRRFAEPAIAGHAARNDHRASANFF